MRNSLILALLGALALSAAPAPVTYRIDFTVAQGTSPEAATFTYDHATQAFTNFAVLFGGATFDLTASANAPAIVGTVPCLHGLTGAAAGFALLNGKCGNGVKGAHWGASMIGAPIDSSGDSLSFAWAASPTGPSIVISATNVDAGGAFPINNGGFSITANPKAAIFHPTGTMSTQRQQHTATLLDNGNVLVSGGQNSSGSLASAELYNPKTGKFSAAQSMIAARYAHTATLLPNGEVLIAGGANTSGTLSEAELYNPKTGKFTATGSMTAPRYDHTATLLPDGKVLIAGGYSPTTAVATAELYNPKTGMFTATGSMTIARASHTATRLEGGKILIAGGFTDPTAVLSPDIANTEEVYNQATGVFTAYGTMLQARQGHTATLLTQGAVLLTGGEGYGEPDKNNVTYTNLPNAELFGDKTAGTLGEMNAPRINHTATLLPDGKVLVAGGAGDDTKTPAQLYLPAFGTFTDAAEMSTTRHLHTATLLDNGKVLIVGGANNSHALASAELFEAANGAAF